MSFQVNIRKLREIRNLTQKEIGNIVGASEKTVSSWEREGKTPNMGKLGKIASYFGITVSALVESEQALADALQDAELLAVARRNRELVLSYDDLPPEEQSAILTLVNSRKKPLSKAI